MVMRAAFASHRTILNLSDDYDARSDSECGRSDSECGECPATASYGLQLTSGLSTLGVERVQVIDARALKRESLKNADVRRVWHNPAPAGTISLGEPVLVSGSELRMEAQCDNLLFVHRKRPRLYGGSIYVNE